MSKFVASADLPEQLPDTDEQEIAVIGRSNVGKSSLLGALLQRPALIRVSKQPGRTQQINLFTWKNATHVVDLPGYGYAKVGGGKKAKMDLAVTSYLEHRQQLRLVILLIDSRREEVSPFDLYVAQWLADHDLDTLVVLTKIDTIPKNRRLHRQRKIEAALGVVDTLMVSARTGEGVDALRKRLFGAAAC